MVAADDTFRHIQLIAVQLASVAAVAADAEPRPQHMRELLDWLHRICYREFARGVIESCRKDFRTDLLEPTDPLILSGDRGLSLDLVNYLLATPPKLHKIPKKKNRMT